MLKNFPTIESIVANTKAFDLELNSLRPKVNPADNPFYFPYIPYGTMTIIKNITQAKEIFKDLNGREAKSFIDIGCGIGNVLYIANLLGLKPYGVDIIPSYVEIAKKVVPNSIVYQADILKWRLEEEIDIIYLFNPIANKQKMEEFLIHLLSFVPKGQIIIGVLLDSFQSFNDKVNHFDINKDIRIVA